jgi:hypothetical protein
MVAVSAFTLPPPSRPRGSWSGAFGWFVAGIAAAVTIAVLAAAIASTHLGPLAMFVLAGGFVGCIWLSTRLPYRHGASFVTGGVCAVVLAVAWFFYELVTTPWSF